MHRSNAILLLALAVVGCQEPFGSDRHDLLDFRVAALRVEVEGPAIVPDVVLSVDGVLWADAPTELAWHWAADDAPGTLDALRLETPIAEGPRPRILRPQGAQILALVATSPAGQTTVSSMLVPDDPSPPWQATGFSLQALDLRVAELEDGDLELDARRKLVGEPAEFAPDGGFARIGVALEPTPDTAPVVRWMMTGGQGTFFELDDTTTDWAHGTVLVDDDEIDEATPGEAGPSTLLALVLDGEGRNRFAIADLWAGPPAPGLITHSGRWMASPELPEDTTLVRATLAADDAGPTGLLLQDAQPIDPADLPATDPYGTEALPCADAVSGPFDPSWLATGRCLRGDVLGATVVVERP